MLINVNKTFNKYQAELFQVTDKRTPQITVSKRKSKLRLKPWII